MMTALQPNTPDLTAAKFALVAAWTACVEISRLAEEPVFVFNGQDAIELDRAAEHLQAMPTPLQIIPTNTAVGLRIAVVEADGSDDTGTFRPLTDGPTTEQRILVVGGRCRLRASPAQIEAAKFHYRLIAPTCFAADFVESGFIESLGLVVEETSGIAEVLVLGRTTRRGWEIAMVPSSGG